MTSSTAAAGRPATSRRDAPLEPPLGALVASWPWALPVALAGLALRIVAVAGIRLHRYFDSAEYEILDFTGSHRRPWTTPLLYELLPDDDASVVAAQTVIGALAWLVLAFAAAAIVRRPLTRVVVAVSVVALGATSAVTNWDTTMLSEPMALALTVLLLAAWIDLVRRPTVIGAGVVVAVTLPWLFVRQSLVPTGWLTLVLAAVGLVVVARRGDRRATLPWAVVVAGLVASCAWATVSYGRNTEILDHNLTTVVAARIAPDDELLAWWVDRGMPLPEDGRRDYGGFDEDTAFQAWVTESGTSTYARFLATHPWYALTEPLEDFVGANPSYQERPPFADPVPPPVAMLAPDEPYGGSRNVIPGPIEDVLLRGGSVGAITTALLVVAGWTLARRKQLDRRWIVPGATVLLAFASLYAAWHGATTELPRLGLPAAVALRVALVLMLALLVEGELDRRSGEDAHEVDAAA